MILHVHTYYTYVCTCTYVYTVYTYTIIIEKMYYTFAHTLKSLKQDFHEHFVTYMVSMMEAVSIQFHTDLNCTVVTTIKK